LAARVSVEVRYDGGAVDAGPLGKIGSRGASHSPLVLPQSRA
jgi:hypothetical protein